MSFVLIVPGVLFFLGLLALSFLIKKEFENSVASIEIKSAGLLEFYRQNVRLALGKSFYKAPHSIFFLHLAALHLCIPVLGLGIFYRSDLNFLPVVAGLLLSMQIHQRIYPGRE